MEECKEVASLDMSQMDSNSAAKNRISCKMVTDNSSIDWHFYIPRDRMYLESKVFSNGKSGCEWKIIYFNMITEIDEGNFCVHYIFLELMSTPKRNILADVHISLRSRELGVKTASSNSEFTVGQNGHIQLIARFTNDISFCRSCKYKNCKCFNGEGYSCRLTVFANYPTREEILENDRLKKNVFSNLVAFCNSNDFDLKIVVKSETTIPVHRMILAARSNVFLAMFQHEMKESNSDVINIVDFDDETIRQLVNFLYKSSLTKDDTELLLKLLMASDKYDICDLRDVCESMLILQLNKSNVIDVLKHAVLIDSLSNLRNVAIALLKTEPNYFSSELKNKLVPVNSLFIEIEKLLKNVNFTDDAIKLYMKKKCK